MLDLGSSGTRTADGGTASDGATDAPASDAGSPDAPPPIDAASDAGPACVETEARLTETSSFETLARIAPAGDGFAVAWEDASSGRASVLRWIAADGSTRGADQHIASPAAAPGLASNGSALMLAADGNDYIRFLRFEHTPSMALASGTYSAFAGEVALPYVARDGDGWVIVWRETITPSGVARVVLQTWDATGAYLPSSADILSDGGFEPDNPSVAVQGDRFFVAWDENDRDAVGEPNGRFVTYVRDDASSVVRGTFGTRSDDVYVAAGDGGFGAVYVEKGGVSSVTVQLFGADGAARGALYPLHTARAHRDEPELAWNGSHWGVVFEEGTEGNTDEVIRFVLVSPDGAIVEERQISHGSAYAQQASIAWNGAGWGIAWRDMRDGNGEIYYAHVCP